MLKTVESRFRVRSVNDQCTYGLLRLCLSFCSKKYTILQICLMQSSGTGNISNLLPSAFADDIAPFLQDGFDPQQWIERQCQQTVRNRGDNAPVMQMSDILSRVNYRLQLVSDSTSGALVRSLNQAQQSFLKSQAPLQTQQGKSCALSTKLHGIRKDIAVVQSSSNSSIESLSSVHTFRNKLVRALEVSEKVREAGHILAQANAVLPDSGASFFLHCRQQQSARALVTGLSVGKDLQTRVAELTSKCVEHAAVLVNRASSQEAAVSAECLVHVQGGQHQQVARVDVDENAGGGVTVEQCTRACTGQGIESCAHYAVQDAWSQGAVESIATSGSSVQEISQLLAVIHDCVEDMQPGHTLFKNGRAEFLWKVLVAFIQEHGVAEYTDLAPFIPAVLACLDFSHERLAQNVLLALDEQCVSVSRKTSLSAILLPPAISFSELPGYISSVLPTLLTVCDRKPVSALQLLERMSVQFIESAKAEEAILHQNTTEQKSADSLEPVLLKCLETSMEQKLALGFSTPKLRKHQVPTLYVSKLHAERSAEDSVTIGNGSDVQFVLHSNQTDRLSHASLLCSDAPRTVSSVAHAVVEEVFWTEAARRLQWRPLRSAATVRMFGGASLELEGVTAFGNQTGMALEAAQAAFLLQSRTVAWPYDRLSPVVLPADVNSEPSLISPFSSVLLEKITSLQTTAVNALCTAFQKPLLPALSLVYAQEGQSTEGPSAVLTKLGDPLFACHHRLQAVSHAIHSRLDMTPARLDHQRVECHISDCSSFAFEFEPLERVICSFIFENIGRVQGSRLSTILPYSTDMVYKTNVIEQAKRDCLFLKRQTKQIHCSASVLNALQLILESGPETTRSEAFSDLLATLANKDQEWLQKLITML